MMTPKTNNKSGSNGSLVVMMILMSVRRFIHGAVLNGGGVVERIVTL